MSKLAEDTARRLANGDMAKVQAVVEAVDRVGKSMDQRWGFRVLPTLVGAEWAERFASQAHKFSEACWRWDVAEVTKHGAAMERAYAKLDEMAVAGGARPAPPEQWEFEAGGELVILVRDLAQVERADRRGRACQVWSLDEIASVVVAHPMLAAAKAAFPGAKLESTRPGRDFKQKLDDTLEGLPF